MGRTEMKRTSIVVAALTAVGVLAACADEPTRPPDVTATEALEPSAFLSSPLPTDEVTAAITVVADAALRVAPAIGRMNVPAESRK
jgi:curli biogenesis system outer membrane secretion channel CsgG